MTDHSLQKTDHNFPEDIDKSIDDFRKKTIPSTREVLAKELSQSGLKIQKRLLYGFHQTTVKQVKDALEL
jgi:hypothetical protein